MGFPSTDEAEIGGLHVGTGLDVEGGVGLHEAFTQTGATVEGAAGGADAAEADVVEVDVVDFAGCVSAEEEAVGTGAKDVVEEDAADFATVALGGSLGEAPSGILVVADGTGIAGDVDGFGLAPPHVTPEAAIDGHIAKGDVGDGALVAVLDAEATVGGGDDAVVEEDVADAVHVLGADFDGTGAAGHGAVGDNDVVAGAVFLELATVFQADAVVAAGDMAVGDAHVAAVVEVDAVAVADFQVVEQGDAVNHGILAANEMYRPIGTVSDGHVADAEVAHCLQGEDVWTGVERRVGEGLQFVGVVEFGTHEGDAGAVDGAAPADSDVLGLFGVQPQHAFATVLTEGAEGVKAFVGVTLQDGRGLQVERDVGFQLDGA